MAETYGTGDFRFEYVEDWAKLPDGWRFRECPGVAVDSHGYVYVSDWGHDIVQVFDPQGGYVTRFIGDCHGYSKWAVARMASDPEGMSKERAVVKDFTIERVFFQPTTVRVDDQDRILVVDTGRHRIQIYERVPE